MILDPKTQKQILTHEESSAAQALRVAIISDACGERNGVGSYYTDLCNHLSPYFQHFELIHPDLETQKRLASRISIPLPGDATQRVQFPLIRSLSGKLSSIRPHVVIIPTPGPFGLVGAHMAARYGSKILIGYHTDYESITSMYWGPVFGLISRSFFEVTNKILFRSSSGTLINSPNVRASAERLGAKNIMEVGTPVSPEFVAPAPPASKKIQHILYAGRLAEEKNLEAFLDAAKKRPHLNFYIAGDGPLRELVEKTTQQLDNLSYLGWIPRDRLPSIMDSSDLLVLPSHVESFGTIALEALARRRNVLVSFGCGIRQWPEFRECLYDFSLKESVAEAIDRICQTSPDERIQRANAGREAALALHIHTLAQWCRILADQSSQGRKKTRMSRLHV